ncbi:MAG: endonuclease/exonuclease/phosphatase family protein [bacterium]
MKLINLNVQCGANDEPFMEFVKNSSIDTDIFCFQEVFNNPLVIRSVLKNARPNLFSELQNLLPDFNSYFAPPVEKDVGGLAIFIKKRFSVVKSDDIVIFSELDILTDRNNKDFFTMGRNVQHLEFVNNTKKYSIFNFHGAWIPEKKKDTDHRIEQSNVLRRIFNKTEGSKILCTDLNIEPNTKSLSILAEGNIDLVQKYGITSTRSVSKGRKEIVDYVIVSPEVEVLKFEVLEVEVSDHLPLMLEFK